MRSTEQIAFDALETLTAPDRRLVEAGTIWATIGSTSLLNSGARPHPSHPPGRRKPGAVSVDSLEAMELMCTPLPCPGTSLARRAPELRKAPAELRRRGRLGSEKLSPCDESAVSRPLWPVWPLWLGPAFSGGFWLVAA
jgi:hypothetical protein